MGYKKSKYNFLKQVADDTFVIYNFRLMSFASLNSEEVKLYNTLPDVVTDIKNPFIMSLYECGFLLDEKCDELKVLRHRLHKARYSNNTLRLVIAPTMKCNFVCTYCYEQMDSIFDMGYMPKDIQQLLLEFIDSELSSCKKFEVIWYGGEPLLGMSIIEYLSEHIVKLCGKYSVDYEATMITNGFLLDRFNCHLFQKCKITTFQITLDGEKEIHNQRRKLKKGMPTYENIVNNIIEYQNHFDIIIRTNIDKSNVSYVKNMIFDLKNRGVDKVTLSFAPVMGDILNGYQEDEFAFIWKDVNACAESLGYNKKNLAVIPSYATYCDADKDRAFVIDPQGNMYKCWYDIGKPTKKIGTLQTNAESGNKELFYDYMTYDVTQDEVCAECKILPACMGGCPHNRIYSLDRCTRYKYILDYILEKLYKNFIEETS